MKQLYLIGLFSLLLGSFTGNAQITLNTCDAFTNDQDFTLTLEGVDGTGRNFYQTNPITGDQPCSGLGACEFRIAFNAVEGRWEILADDGDGDFTTSYVLYYNSSASTPNPPDLTLGTWVENSAATLDLCNAVEVLTGDVQATLSRTNEAPVATAPSSITGVEEDVPYALPDAIEVADADGDNLRLSFTITGGTLSIGTSGITFGGSGNGSASFTASGTLADLNTALDAASFTSNVNLNGNGAGTIAFVANDGVTDSNTASVTFDIAAVNDAPQFVDANRRIDYTEGGAVASFSEGGSIFLQEVDNDNIVEAVITLNSPVPGDVINVPASVFTVSQSGNTTTLSGSGTAAQMVAVLEAITYSNTGDDPTVGGTRNSRILGIVVEDVTGLVSNELSIGIGIIGVNDLPYFNGLPTDVTFVEGVSSGIDLSAATFGDVDSGSGIVTLSLLVSGGTLSATSTAAVAVSYPIPGTLTLEGTAAAIENFLNTPSNIQYTNAPGAAGDDAGSLSLSANDNGNTGTGTISSVGLGNINIDVVPRAELSVIATTSAAEDATNGVFTVSTSRLFTTNTQVSISLSGTASVGTDYAAIGGSFEFPANTGSVTVTIPVVTDNLAEDTETVILTLTGTNNPEVVVGSVNQALINITDNDPVPNISINDVSVDENEGVATFTLSLSEASGQLIRVDYATSGLTAMAPSDYTDQSGTIDFLPGETTKAISITINNDTVYEEDEEFMVSLSAPVNVSLVNATGIGTIQNEDPIPSVLGIGAFHATEGATLKYVVTFNKSAAADFSISHSIGQGGTASAADYETPIYNNGVRVDGTNLIIPAGVDRFEATLVTVDDLLNEATERVPFTLGALTLNGIIYDNDPAPELSITSANVNEDAGTASFEVRLSAPSGRSVSVNYASADGTALAGSDYTSVSGTLNFSEGEVSKTIEVPILDDLIVEGPENFSINLSGPVNASVATSTGTATIIDNDPEIPEVTSVSVPANGAYGVGQNLDFIINFSEAVVVNTAGGTPGLILNIGGVNRTASYVSGSGSTALVFRYQVVSGDLDMDGIEIPSFSLYSGTIQSTTGIDADLTLNSVGSTSGVLVDALAPAGYSVSIDLLGEFIINVLNETIIEFAGTGMEPGATLYYSFTSSTGGGAVSGTETVTSTNQTFNNAGAGYDLSGLSDGTITLSVYLVDVNLNQGTTATDTENKDAVAPTGYSVAWDDLLININEATGTSFTVSGAETGATLYYTITSSGDGNTASISGNHLVTTTTQVFNVDVSALSDGNLTIQIFLRDAGGNRGANTSDNSAILDQTPPVAPGIPDLIAASDTGVSTTDNITNDLTPTLSGTAEAFAQVALTSDLMGALGTATADAGGNWSFTASTAMTAGIHTITAAATDVAGNTGLSSPALIVTFDNQAPNLSLIAGLSLQLDAVGATSTLTASDLLSTPVTDDFTVSTAIQLSLDQNQFDCSDTGANTVQVTATDLAGNAAILTTSIQVIDALKPTITAKSGITLNVGAFETVDLTMAMIDEGSADNCGIQSQALSKTTFDRTDEGVNNVTYTVTDTSGNPSQVTIAVTIVVIPKVLDISATAGQSKVYGTADPVFTYTASGLEGGDDVSIITGALARDPGAQVGIYGINQGTLDAGPNYSINYIGSTFEITKADLMVTADNKTKVYGQADPAFTVSYSGFENGDTEAALGGSLSFSRVPGEDVGSYAITASGYTSANYTISYTTGNLVITQASQIITFEALPVLNLETDADFQLQATASSGLPVTYTYTYTTAVPAALVTEAGFVSLVQSGSIIITASQAGNQNYLPATPVSQELSITSSDASVHSLTIGEEEYLNPGSLITYVIECGTDVQSLDVSFITEANALSMMGKNFSIAVPAPGIYRTTFTITSQDGTNTQSYTIEINKRFLFEEIVVQKFNNTLLVNNNPSTNGGYRFVGYRWFKNGQLVGNGQYFSEGDESTDLLDPIASYRVEMILENGDVLSTCTFNIELEATGKIQLAPNPVLAGTSATLFASFDKDELQDMKISILSLQGTLIETFYTSSSKSIVQMPAGIQAGVYVLVCETNKQTQTVQFIVH